MEASPLEKGVGGVGKCTAHTRHSTNGVGAGTQVGDTTQKLKCVAFLLVVVSGGWWGRKGG